MQFVLLAALTWLASADEPVTQRALAELAVTDPMMTSQVLRALEQRGLVRRGAHPFDQRARALSVTASGRELANRAVSAVEAADAAFFAALGRDTGRFAADLRTLRGRA